VGLDEDRSSAIPAPVAEQHRLRQLPSLIPPLVHRLGNALTAIGGMASMLAQESAAGGADEVDLIQRESKRSMESLRAMSLFATDKEPRLEAMDLGEVLAMAAELVEPLALEQGTRFEVRRRRGVVIRDDRRRLLQVLVVTMVEILQHCSPVRLRVTARCSSHGAKLALVWEGGVPENLADIIFESVSSRGGELRMRERESGWSGMTIGLGPLLDAPRPEAVSASRPDRRASRSRILVLQGDPALSELVATVLSEDGHRVECARNAEAAHGLVRGTAFDLLIVDGDMGAETPDLVAAVDGPRRGIVLSSDGNGTSELGPGWERISKPFRPVVLLEKVRTLLG